MKVLPRDYKNITKRVGPVERGHDDDHHLVDKITCSHYDIADWALNNNHTRTHCLLVIDSFLTHVRFDISTSLYMYYQNSCFILSFPNYSLLLSPVSGSVFKWITL